jgi:hypothetical protein
MKKKYGFVVAALFLVLGHPADVVASPASASPVAQQRLDALFHRWQMSELNLPEVHRAARRSGRIQLRLGEQNVELELEPNDLRAPGFRQELHTERGTQQEVTSAPPTFKGRIAGDPDSTVRLLILPDLLQGYVRTKNDWYFVDPLLKYVKGAPPAKVVVFKKDDVRPEATKLCGAGELSDVAAGLSSPDESSMAYSYSSGPRGLQVATEADYEYYSLYGSNTNYQIQGVLNQVDGIYQANHNIAILIQSQSVWTTSNDPYSASDSLTLLNQFRNYWNAYRSNYTRDVAHLFTGRAPAEAIGRAWLGVVCNSPGYAYGVSYDFSLMAKLVAHEIGHNLGASHDDEVSPPADACYGSGPIMCAYIQTYGPDVFSSRSVSDISWHVNQHGSCMSDLGCENRCHEEYDYCTMYNCDYGDCRRCQDTYRDCLWSCR